MIIFKIATEYRLQNALLRIRFRDIGAASSTARRGVDGDGKATQIISMTRTKEADLIITMTKSNIPIMEEKGGATRFLIAEEEEGGRPEAIEVSNKTYRLEKVVSRSTRNN